MALRIVLLKLQRAEIPARKKQKTKTRNKHQKKVKTKQHRCCIIMSSSWTAQDVERFREQQRWRLRHKANQQQQQQHAAMFKRTHSLPVTDTDTGDRARKVPLKFRREHQQFLSTQQMPAHLSALAVTLRPTFAVPKQRNHIESPLPHTDHVMFNAFDSTASPEAFCLEPENNQEELMESWSQHKETLSEPDTDMVMVSDGDDEMNDAARFENSLWRRRFMQGMVKRSPKLGRVALWEAVHEAPSACGGGDNQLTELRRVPLPFASESLDDTL